MTPGEHWLEATWAFVERHLPPPPAAVIEIGCGSLGGFVPRLLAAGYDAVGIDPKAPEGPHYEQVEFERAEPLPTVDAVVACTSLHHVSDPANVIDAVVETVRPGGTMVVVEWASERFDEETARWCFERLGDEEGWLRRLSDEWRASALDWPSYFSGWLEEERLHPGELLVGVLDERLERRLLSEGPYFFADLASVTEAEEQAAIDAGQIQPNRLDYVGRRA
jgi:SAM-dependent methyltransferase